MQMELHVKSWAIVVRFWNHKKTLLAPVETLIYVIKEMEAVIPTQ